MKHSISGFAILIILSLAGCEAATNPFAYSNDPVARATGSRWSWEGSGHFDAGVIIIRFDNVDAQSRYDGRMEFDVDNNPVQASGASINGSLLQWNATEQPLYHANIYESQDSSGFGAIDSATFSYAGYDGESWSQHIHIAPDFAPVDAPDTVSISQGLAIQYQNPVSKDSISLSITAEGDWTTTPPIDSLLFHTTLVDNGSIHISSSQLPRPNGTYGYLVQLSRFRFASLISPKGKVIGIYSEMNAPLLLNVKP